MPPISPPAQAPKPDDIPLAAGPPAREDRYVLGEEQRSQPAALPLQSPREHSFTALYRQHVERIYRYHLARTGNAEDAQDLTAETFHAALESFASFDPALGKPAAWLAGIAQHKLVDHFRRSPRTDPRARIDDQADPAPSPEEASARHLQMAQVSAALRTLPGERAEALSLHFFAGLSLTEAAQVMRRSEEAVKKLIHRGLADLRRRLAYPPGGAGSVEVNE